MVSVKSFTYNNWEFLMALYDGELAYFGLKSAADEILKKDFPKDEIVEVNDGFALIETQLQAYFDGNLKVFDIPLYISGTSFQKAVYKVLSDVKYKEVISYTELARRVGDVKKVRAVANAIGKNRHLIVIPCHRIIAKDGSMGGYSGGLDLKEVLLNIERSA
jgi:methylated-DNA-[protein]-cysteine S-methyltransferase